MELTLRSSLVEAQPPSSPAEAAIKPISVMVRNFFINLAVRRI
jgi:hypothetical protein